jgi:hypothetical protein
MYRRLSTEQRRRVCGGRGGRKAPGSDQGTVWGSEGGGVRHAQAALILRTAVCGCKSRSAEPSPTAPVLLDLHPPYRFIVLRKTSHSPRQPDGMPGSWAESTDICYGLCTRTRTRLKLVCFYTVLIIDATFTNLHLLCTCNGLQNKPVT